MNPEQTKFLVWLRKYHPDTYRQTIEEIRARSNNLNGLGDWLSDLLAIGSKVPDLATQYGDYKNTQAQIDAQNKANQVAIQQSGYNYQSSVLSAENMKMFMLVGGGLLALYMLKNSKKRK